MKYYKAEDVERILKELSEEPNYLHPEEDWLDGICIVETRVESLPTIEVSEDCIGKAEVLSIISDCQDINDKAKYNTLAEVFNKVLDAPSAVPKQSELTEAYTRGYKDGAEQTRAEGEWEVVPRIPIDNYKCSESDLMPWEDFIESKNCRFANAEPTHIACPKCGKRIYMRTDIILTCYPPKHQYFCGTCDWVGSA